MHAKFLKDDHSRDPKHHSIVFAGKRQVCITQEMARGRIPKDGCCHTTMIKTMVLDPTYKSQSFSVEQKLATQAEKELREVLKELQEGYFEKLPQKRTRTNLRQSSGTA